MYYSFLKYLTQINSLFILLKVLFKLAIMEDGQTPSGQKPSTEILPTRTKAQQQICHLGQKPSNTFAI